MTKSKSANPTPATIWKFIDSNGSFHLENPGQFSRLYFPLANEAGMLASITPKLKGDTKSGQDAFLTLPVSSEDLHNSKTSRNFWVIQDGKNIWSAAGVAKNKKNFQDLVSVEAGQLFHQLTRDNHTLSLKAVITNFIPSSGDHVEIMRVEIHNTGSSETEIEAWAAVPMYARSADNLRDHRHVTSLLHRIEAHHNGVLVTPTMTFDERGHQINRITYAVLGADGQGKAPDRVIPTVEGFIGEGGSFEYPKSLFEADHDEAQYANIQGKEAMGALHFPKVKLKPGAKAEFIVLLGIAHEKSEIAKWLHHYASAEKVEKALAQTKEFWKAKSTQVVFETADPVFNGWLRWVGLQPVFRKIFGCSFLPDFDYGRGGRGWRDLWQDCLALLLTHPEETRDTLLHNYGGVRIDGSNATIISAGDHRFIADRNSITRVWMDHGVWPFVTTELYLHESGDMDFLLKKAPYFRDTQQSRAAKKDAAWNEAYGTRLKTKSGKIYQGTLIEHILIQHLVQFFNVGSHNHIRLECADWNDGLDMAAEKGESVAFTAFYAGNLRRIAALLDYLGQVKNLKTLELAKELDILIDADGKNKPAYHNVAYKRETLERYFKAVQPKISGKTRKFAVSALVQDLNAKADYLTRHVRVKEWIKVKSGHEFFNGYYDNQAKRVEGDHAHGVRMTLTGQVFAAMSGVADQHQVSEIIKSVNKYLKDPVLGGVRLNTDFKDIQPDLGRAFSFAYGEKENGAFFNHMQVMYANALYKRGFVQEGYEVLKGIFRMAVSVETSRIYPGLPEYFNSEGRGMYHYLTGSASWYFMTLLTESFGVKGHYGDLLIEPKLTADQFVGADEISVTAPFADRKLRIVYRNADKLCYGQYRVAAAELNGKPIESQLAAQDAVLIARDTLTRLSATGEHTLTITLEAKSPSAAAVAPVYTSPVLLANLRQKELKSSSGKKSFKERRLLRLPKLNKLSFKHL
ncbi:MAG: cellobiose phosphorylase [Candidatus Omnitrophica bacterium]|nr:cellobiose phosphorylase [Candidatus Omnitrophota bacterium]